MTPYVRIVKDDILWEGFLEHIPRKGDYVTVKNVIGIVYLIYWRMPQFLGSDVDPQNRFEVDIHLGE